MTKTKKIFTGILAILPLILFIVYFVVIFFSMMKMINTMMHSSNGQAPVFDFLPMFYNIWGIMALLMIVSIAKLIYFIIHIVNNPKLDSNERLVWILIGIFVGMFGFPVYWYLKIWKEDPTVE